MKAGELAVRSTVEGDRHTLALTGELDLATAPALEGDLRAACEAGAGELLLDLSELSFIDSTGLRAVLVGRMLCEEHQCSYRLVPGGPQVQRLFELAGVLDQLTFVGPGGTPS
jgi:anti-sigma B factor antagonist